MNWLRSPMQAAGRVLGRHRRVSRAVAAAALLYSLLLVLTGGFDLALGSLSFRSHEINRFIELAVIAIAADLLGDPRVTAWLDEWLAVIERLMSCVWRVLAVVVIGGVVLTGVLWVVARVAAGMSGETPSGDWALLELYTIDAVKNRLLLGPYSRFGWHHPGPAMFYLFKPLYAMSGGRYESLRWSSLLINVATLMAVLAIVRRHATAIAGFVLVAALGGYLFRVPEMLASPWNPHLLILPLVLLVVSCAAVIEGAPRYWPLVAAVASFLVQTHLSVAPTVGVLVVATMIWVITQRPDPVTARRHVVWGNVALWVLVALWMLPLADQFASADGNLTHIYRSFFQQPMAAPSLRAATAAFLAMLSAPVLSGLTVAWGGLVIQTVSVTGAVIAVGSLLAIPWTARQLGRAGDRFGAAIAALAGTASLASLWSVSHIQGEILDQLVFWITALGVLNLACLTAALVLAIRRGLANAAGMRLATSLAAVVALVGSTVLGTMSLYDAHRAAVAEPAATPRVRSIIATLDQYLAHEGLHQPLVRISQPTWGTASGVVLALNKAGIRMSVEPAWLFMFGTERAATGAEDCEIVIADAALRDSMKPDDRFTSLASWPDMSILVASPAVRPGAARSERGTPGEERRGEEPLREGEARAQ